MFCFNCGTKLEKDAKFCTNCGATMQQPVQQTTQQPTQQPTQETTPQPAQINEQPPVQLHTHEPQIAPTYQSVQYTSQQEPMQETAPLQNQPYYPQQHPQHPQYPQHPQQHQQYSQHSQQPQYSQYPQHPQQPQYPQYQQHPQVKKSGGIKKYWWTIAAAIILAVGVTGTFWFLAQNTPVAKAAKAFANLSDELNTRVSGTPLEVIPQFSESLTNGVVTVGFDYSDRWSNSRGTMTLKSDSNRSEFAFDADLFIEGVQIEGELFLNKESAALRVLQFNENFYGINYKTFKDDFTSFANILGLDRYEIDEITSFVDTLSELMNSITTDAILPNVYNKLLMDFLKEATVGTNKVDIISGGDNVSATKIEFLFTDKMIIEFLNDVLDAYSNDESARNAYNSTSGLLYSQIWYGFPSFDESVRNMRNTIRELEREFLGEIAVDIYTGKNDRLLRVEVVADLEIIGRESFVISTTLDFGASAKDLWILEMNFKSEWVESTYLLRWSLYESADGAGNTKLSFSVEDNWWSDTYEVTLNWTNRGDFTLSVEEGFVADSLLSGTFRKQGDSFNLTLDNLFADSFYDHNLTFDISTEPLSGRIQNVNFVNIKDWDEALLEKIETFVMLKLLNIPDDIYDPYDPPFIDPPIIDPTPIDPTTPPNPGVGDAINKEDLIGTWAFSSGSITYVFWRSDKVEFFTDGNVYASEDEIWATWELNGNELIVEFDWSVYHFTVAISDNILSITDHDDDTGYFERTG
ncbi:MAG: zinc ribbon domain-containing protein [Oscillospiraceae bacterium]|jgi:hypothetical protein|nr:zinc ribbon domain-containing protein [Oscillospiraceae bacterium]